MSKAVVPFRTLALLLGLLASVLASAPAWAVPPDPGTTGPFAVGHTSFEAIDTDRGDRELTVDLWYPANAAAVGEPTFYQLLDILIAIIGITSEVALEDVPLDPSGLRPLVLFSHGSGGFNIQSIVLMETLASHGFIVAAPNHTGNSVFDEPGDTPFEDPATDRPKDISFLIDLLLARSNDPVDPLYLALDPFAIGATGHSFGGFTAVAMAAGYEASAFGPVPPDPRVRAILPVSGTTGSFSDAELESIVIPTLFLGGTLDTAVPIDPNTTRPFALLGSESLYRADVIGATHTHFANICDIADALIEVGLVPDLWPVIGAEALVEPYNDTCIPPAFSLAEVKRIQNLYTVAFFRRHLLQDLSYAQFLRESYAAENEPDVDFFEAVPATKDKDTKDADKDTKDADKDTKDADKDTKDK